jgi:hypothetical protein
MSIIGAEAGDEALLFGVSIRLVEIRERLMVLRESVRDKAAMRKVMDMIERCNELEAKFAMEDGDEDET